MAQPTAQEQYMLELVNQARRDPGAEANRFGIGLNQGLASGTISNTEKQPLAFNFDLMDSSRAHSQWMLDTNRFSHTGVGGSSAGDRMRDAGYSFTGSWTWGENLAWRGTTGTPNVTGFITTQHEGLFRSAGHRTNLLNGSFKEIGIGALTGEFNGYNTVMTTQNFAKSGPATFLTGVAYDDAITDDDFYTVGEGLGGIRIEATRQSDDQVFSTQTFNSGGYQLALTPGIYDVTFSGNELSQNIQKTFTIGNQNIKFDLATDQLPVNTGAEESPAPTPEPLPPVEQPPAPMPEPQPPVAEEPPAPSGDNTIGEYGSLNLNHSWQTISLDNDYLNPVVMVSDPTFNGADPAAIRLKKVTGNTFQIRLQEPKYKDGTHTTESVSYLVMEAGDWTLSDGTRISAGTHQSNRLTSQGFDTINLDDFDATPTVLSQVQTYNGSDWVTTRTTGQSADGFQLAMQEVEARNQGGHLQENIGWLAIEQGVASDGDTLLQGGTTGRSYDHDRATVTFEEAFEAAPSVIAKLGSFHGPDTANIRLDGITTTRFGVGVHEEQSLDAEMNHTNESVAFLALEGKAGTLSGLAA